MTEPDRTALLARLVWLAVALPRATVAELVRLAERELPRAELEAERRRGESLPLTPGHT